MVRAGARRLRPGLFRSGDDDATRGTMTRFVSVLLPVAVDAPYTYRTPENLDLKPGRHRRRAARHTARGRRGLGRPARRDDRSQSPARCRISVRCSAVDEDAPRLCRLGGGLHDRHPRHGAPHGAALTRRAGTRQTATGRAPRRATAGPHDAGPRARPQDDGRRQGLVAHGSCSGRGREPGRHRRTSGGRHARDDRAAADARRAAARSGFRQA